MQMEVVMYTDQHTPWEPGALLLGDSTLTDDLTIASFLHPRWMCEYDLATLLRVRQEATWIMVEMMGYAPGRLGSDDAGDDEPIT